MLIADKTLTIIYFKLTLEIFKPKRRVIANRVREGLYFSQVSLTDQSMTTFTFSAPHKILLHELWVVYCLLHSGTQRLAFVQTKSVLI